MEKMYKYFPKECLPIEFLPDGYTGPNAGTLQSLIGLYCLVSVDGSLGVTDDVILSCIGKESLSDFQ